MEVHRLREGLRPREDGGPSVPQLAFPLSDGLEDETSLFAVSWVVGEDGLRG
jgi:hypothetical protein